MMNAQTDSQIADDMRNPANADKNLVVRFFQKPKKNKFKSREQGKPVYVNQDYVEIRVPGSSDVVSRKAEDKDKKRFPRQWQAYQTNTEFCEDGIPLDTVSFLTAANVAMLKDSGIKTVEQLAGINEANAADVGIGVIQLIDLARGYLDSGTTVAKLAELQHQNDLLKNELQSLRDMIKEHGVKPKVKKVEGKDNELVDTAGNVFDPSIHYLKDGEPALTETGRFRKKRGR